MNTEQLISIAIPTLHPDDTGNRALDLMDENTLTQLPVVDNDMYVALVQESDLLGWQNPGDMLSKSTFLNYKPAITAWSHPYEALRLSHQMHLSVVPVIDREGHYLGAISDDGLLRYVTENSGINTPGGIVVLEIAPRNYTLYEIARICENEDFIIMNVQVHATETGMLEVTLKLNRSSIDVVVAAFERYNYHVKASYGEEGHDDDIAGKYNLLMNYINM